MKKQKKTKEPTACKNCAAWGGYAIPERDRGDRKFLCLVLNAPAGTRKRANGVCWKIATTPPEPPPEPEVVQDQAPAETPATPPPVAPGPGDYIDLPCDKVVFVSTSAGEGEPYFEEPTEIETEVNVYRSDRPMIGSAEDEFGEERCFKCGQWISSAGYCKKHRIEIRAEGTCVIGKFIAEQP